MSEFKSWEEMGELEQLCSIHYDMYKDVHGIRPRWMNYEAMTLEQIKTELDFLAEDVKRVRAEEEAHEREAIRKFENLVQTVIAAGAEDRKTALRWIFQANLSGADLDYLCYCQGLPYGYIKEDEV